MIKIIHNPAKQCPNSGSNVQTHEPVGDILHSNHNYYFREEFTLTLVLWFDSQVLRSVPVSHKTVFESESTHCLDLSFPHPGLWECPLDCEEFIGSRAQGTRDIWACQRSHLSPASTLTLPISISLPRPHPRPVPPLDQGHPFTCCPAQPCWSILSTRLWPTPFTATTFASCYTHPTNPQISSGHLHHLSYLLSPGF